MGEDFEVGHITLTKNSKGNFLERILKLIEFLSEDSCHIFRWVVEGTTTQRAKNKILVAVTVGDFVDLATSHQE